MDLIERKVSIPGALLIGVTLIIEYSIDLSLNLSTIILVKKKEVEKRLRKLGWWFKSHGGNHDIWTNGEGIETVPRHNEINEYTSKSILRNAEKGRKNKGG